AAGCRDLAGGRRTARRTERCLQDFHPCRRGALLGPPLCALGIDRLEAYRAASNGTGDGVLSGRVRKCRRRTAAVALLCAAAALAAGPAGPADAAPGEYSPAALYNQANAYARQGNAAMAVL